MNLDAEAAKLASDILTKFGPDNDDEDCYLMFERRDMARDIAALARKHTAWCMDEARKTGGVK